MAHLKYTHDERRRPEHWEGWEGTMEPSSYVITEWTLQRHENLQIYIILCMAERQGFYSREIHHPLIKSEKRKRYVIQRRSGRRHIQRVCTSDSICNLKFQLHEIHSNKAQHALFRLKTNTYEGGDKGGKRRARQLQQQQTTYRRSTEARKNLRRPNKLIGRLKLVIEQTWSCYQQFLWQKKSLRPQ